MHTIRRSYLHRSDGIRRRIFARRALLLTGLLLTVGGAIVGFRTPDANASTGGDSVPFFLRGEMRRLHEQLNAAKGELDLTTTQLGRANRVIAFSTEYKIPADLAGDIFDIALAEGIDPALAFRLVRIESRFNERATSPVGAIGLTQLMPATANYFERGVTKERLYDRRTNLRIGFRYLRTLVKEYGGDVRLALLVYNRGPAAVESNLRAGIDPGNGYARIVMKEYSGRGTVD